MLLDLYNKIGFAVCHQMPSRSIFIDGLKMPVDARETGIFVGFLLTLIILFLINSKATQLPPRSILIIGICAIAVLAFDGISSYLGFRETTNATRLATGLPVGAFITLLIYPTYKELKGESNDDKALSQPIHQLILLTVLASAFTIIMLKISFLKFILPTAIVSGIVSAFILLNLAIVSFFSSRKVINWPSSVLLTILELLLTYNLHAWVLSLSSQ